MRVAVPYEDGQIFQHFGHTQFFKLYDVEEGQIRDSSVIATGDSGHGALAGMLTSLNVDTLICGGIGGGAKTALANAGIRLYGGVSGETDQAVKNLLADQLNYDPDATCKGHGDHDHADGHSCGESCSH